MDKITEIIKYEGNNRTFVWKYPDEDFNNLTQLIVHESQEAIFFMNGQALDVFSSPGRYTLETENIPLLSKCFKRVTGDTTPFHCEVYFINRTTQMAIKWGAGEIKFKEPIYGFPLEIGASGEMVLRVDNGKKLLLKLVGTENTLSQSDLVNFFRGILNTKIKTYISQTIRKENINIFEITEYLDEFSERLCEKLKPEFANYGIMLENFVVSNIAEPNDSPMYDKFKELHFRQYSDIAEAKLKQQVDIINEETKAKKMNIEAEALARKRQTEGYTYQQERGFDVAGDVAKNENVGQYTGLGIGLGTMAGVGGTIGGMLNKSINAFEEKDIYCEHCGTKLPRNARFCLNCGNPIKPKDCLKCQCCGADLPANSKFCLQCGEKCQGVKNEK